MEEFVLEQMKFIRAAVWKGQMIRRLQTAAAQV